MQLLRCVLAEPRREAGVVSQNTSTAVMARRHEPPDLLDYFPTPSWSDWHGHTRLFWIPQCRRQMERPGDYPAPAPAPAGGLLAGAGE